MKNKDNKLDELFKQTLGNLNVEPPSGLWKKIENKLNASTATRRKRRIVGYWSLSILLLIGTSFSLYKIFDQPKEKMTFSTTSTQRQYVYKQNANYNSSNNITYSLPKSEKQKSSKIISENTIAHKTVPHSYSSKVKSTTSSSNSNTKKNTSYYKTPKKQSKNNVGASLILADNSKQTSPTENKIVERDVHIPLLPSERKDSVELMDEYVLPSIKVGKTVLVNGNSDTLSILCFKEEVINLYQKTSKKWILSFFASPDYSYRNLIFLSSQSEKAKYFDRHEAAQIAYTIGINMSYNLSENFSLRSGLDFFKTGQTSSNIEIVKSYSSTVDPKATTVKSVPTATYTIKNSLGDISLSYNQMQQLTIPSNYSSTTYNLPAKPLKLKQEFYFVSIPLSLTYHFPCKKVVPFLSMGGSVNYQVGKNQQLNSLQLNYKNEKAFSEYSFSSLVSMGVSYRINSSYFISLEPFFRYALTPLYQENDIKWYPYSGGVAFRGSYKF